MERSSTHNTIRCHCVDWRFRALCKGGTFKIAKAAAYRNFFRWCHDNSTEDCALSLQSIVYENYDEDDANPFVESIFPESELPRVSEILSACEGLFEVVMLRNDRMHYAKTLQSWYANLRKNREAAIAMVGESVYKSTRNTSASS